MSFAVVFGLFCVAVAVLVVLTLRWAFREQRRRRG
jgi:hypothetical protein